MKNKKKLLVVLACLALCVCTVVTGTLAWLTDTSKTVTNTFTTSNITIELTETENLNLKMVPGGTITKDPKVTVKAGSEDCLLFVKIVEEYGADEYLDYTVDGWNPLDGVPGVYYREVTGINNDKEFPVLTGNVVTVNGANVTKAVMDAIDAGTAENPTLTFTAYACQLNKNSTTKFTAAEAWALVKDLPANP